MYKHRSTRDLYDELDEDEELKEPRHGSSINDEELTSLTKKFEDIRGKKAPAERIKLCKRLFWCTCCCCYLLIFTLALAAVVGYITVLALYPTSDESYWNWEKITIDFKKRPFPKTFMWGTATAAHQVEGYNTNNQWYEFENKVNPATGKSYILNGDKSGAADDHYNRYADDIQLMKNELNVDAYRFSVEWSRIEPEQGVINQTAVDHYHDVIDTLLAAGIKPMITLHHFTEPIWFFQKGGFEVQSNIDYFVNFSRIVFQEYQSKVDHWCTINEPNVYTLQGWVVGEFPPAKVDKTAQAGEVLKNLMEAHVRVYQELKAMEGGDKATIGLVMNVCQFDPLSKWNPVDRIISHLLNGVYNYAVIDFLRTGYFRFYQPMVVDVQYHNPLATKSLDFIGLNYYYHSHVQGDVTSLSRPYKFVNLPGETFTDMEWPVYPEGIYRAISFVSQLDKPIIITENGIADNKDDRRETFIKRYLWAVNEAIKDGYNVKGYFYWSFMDNFEWAKGFYPRFGLYAVDYETQTRTLREGSKVFVEAIKYSKEQ